jgi:formiminoglutamate deiminase
MPVAGYHAQWAWLGGDRAESNVLIEVADGRIVGVSPGATRSSDAVALPGLTLPGLANAHSHAFHRALRGRTQDARGTFWTWRERMYAVAARLDPDSYYALARATFAEMALAGITVVGEFHYLHHGPDGARYADPNAMGATLVAAAADAGIRITLLDTCYLTSTVDGQPPQGVQRRFADPDVAAWGERAAALKLDRHARHGAAIHSVRAVPAEQMPSVVAWAAERDVPLHLHLSELRAENNASRTRYGRTPTEVLADAGALGPRTTAVHATHLSDSDRTELGDTDTAVCLCPTTERDLADGIGPARGLADAGSPLCLGSDSHAVIDLFEEARAVELNERLRTERRGHFSPASLLHAATAAGHASLGWPDAGMLAPGARADLVTVRLDTVRTAGIAPGPRVVFAATAADVAHVVVDGSVVVRDGVHCALSDVAGELAASIRAVT